MLEKQGVTNPTQQHGRLLCSQRENGKLGPEFVKVTDAHAHFCVLLDNFLKLQICFLYI